MQGRGIGGGERVPANESCKSVAASQAASSIGLQSPSNGPPEIPPLCGASLELAEQIDTIF